MSIVTSVGMVVLGLVGGHALAALQEWFWHRHLFHGVGGKKGSPVAFHLREHHPRVKAAGGRDVEFDRWSFRMNPEGGPHNGRVTELLALSLLAVVHSPLLLVWPSFWVGMLLHGLAFHLMHRRCHVDPEWMRLQRPGHWAHHMYWPNHNFCVTVTWVDRLLGTYREPNHLLEEAA